MLCLCAGGMQRSVGVRQRHAYRCTVSKSYTQYLMLNSSFPSRHFLLFLNLQRDSKMLAGILILTALTDQNVIRDRCTATHMMRLESEYAVRTWLCPAQLSWVPRCRLLTEIVVAKARVDLALAAPHRNIQLSTPNPLSIPALQWLHRIPFKKT